MKKLAVLGPKGTYSDLACKNLKTQYEIEYYSNIFEVLEHIDSNQDGFLPFENTLDGFVMEALDGMMRYNLNIQEQVKLNVNFQFISKEQGLDKIQHVYVQFKAYGQCLDFITQHHLNPIITQSNMESLNLLKANCERGYAALVPAHTDTSEFSYVEKNIISNSHNETRFVLLSKNRIRKEDIENFNSSIKIIPNLNEPGILYSILKMFGDFKINLKSILSRPKKDWIGKYIFYLEIEGTSKDIHALEAVGDLVESLGCTFQILGIYNAL